MDRLQLCEIRNITINQILMLLLGLFPVIMQVMCAVLEKQNKKEKELNNSAYIKKPVYVEQHIFDRSDLIQQILAQSFVFTGLFLATVIVSLVAPDYYVVICSRKDLMVSIVIGLTGIVMTISAFLITLDKNYYLCFNSKEVLSFYGYNGDLFGNGLSCIVVCVLALIFAPELGEDSLGTIASLLLCFTALNIYCTIRILTNLYRLMFSQMRTELDLLKQLHFALSYEYLDVVNMKKRDKWDEDGSKICVHYLVSKYNKSYTKFKIDGIRMLRFATPLKVYLDKWHRKTKGKAFVFGAIWMALFCYVAWQEGEARGIVLILGMVQLMLLAGCTFSRDDAMMKALVRLYQGEWGYYVVDYFGNENFVAYQLFGKKPKYKKYIERMEDMVAFFYIQNCVSVSDEIMLAGVNEACELMKGKKESSVYYLPIFTIGYMLFQKSHLQGKLGFIKELYLDLTIPIAEKQAFSEMLYSQIFYLCHGQFKKIPQIELTYRNYIHWLRDEKV